MNRTYVRSQTLFTGLEDSARTDQVLIVEDGLIAHVGPAATAPAPLATDTIVDAGEQFVMPGLVDVHTHLIFGNAQSEEDIDLHVSPEFRALRGLFFVQHGAAPRSHHRFIEGRLSAARDDLRPGAVVPRP